MCRLQCVCGGFGETAPLGTRFEAEETGYSGPVKEYCFYLKLSPVVENSSEGNRAFTGLSGFLAFKRHCERLFRIFSLGRNNSSGAEASDACVGWCSSRSGLFKPEIAEDAPGEPKECSPRLAATSSEGIFN